MTEAVDEVGPGPRADGAPQSRRYGTTALALTGLAGIALGGLVGSLVTRSLAPEQPPSRIFIAAGVPKKSVGDMVFPVSVVNAGPEPLTVVGVRLARNETAGTPLELVGAASPTVPPNAEGEFFVRAPATCPPELQGQPAGVQLSLVIRSGDGEQRPAFYRLESVVPTALASAADC
jgi:hypothetical protein